MIDTCVPVMVMATKSDQVRANSTQERNRVSQYQIWCRMHKCRFAVVSALLDRGLRESMALFTRDLCCVQVSDGLSNRISSCNFDARLHESIVSQQASEAVMDVPFIRINELEEVNSSTIAEEADRLESSIKALLE